MYALKFQSEQILLSDAIGPGSQILYNRHPLQRVQAAAPYLRLDNDPYPAVVNGRIVWIVDGYTTTDSFPYSTRNNMQANRAIRAFLPRTQHRLLIILETLSKQLLMHMMAR